MLQPSVIHNHHHQVDAFDANLQSPASATDGYKRWSAPAVCCTAGSNSATMFAADDKSTLHQVRNHDDTLRVFHHFVRNPLVRRRHDGVKYFRRHLQTLDRILAPSGSPEVSACQRKGADQ